MSRLSSPSVPKGHRQNGRSQAGPRDSVPVLQAHLDADLRTLRSRPALLQSLRGTRDTYLLQGDDKKGATSCTLGDYGQEAGIDCAEVVVVDVLGDGDPIKAVLPVGHLPVHVPELGTAVLRSPGHLQGTDRGKFRLTIHEAAGQGTGESEMRRANGPSGSPSWGMRGDRAAKSVGPTVLAERVSLTQSPAGGCSQLSCLLSTCPTLFWKEYWVLSLPVTMTWDTVSQPRTRDGVLTAQTHFTQHWMLGRLSVHKDRGQCQRQGWGRHLMLKEGSHYISSWPPSPQHCYRPQRG